MEPHLPYRVSRCRIAEVINFSFVPFKKTINYLGTSLEINEYKGSARITFVWDNPESYS
jgi:hypothetical protein